METTSDNKPNMEELARILAVYGEADLISFLSKMIGLSDEEKLTVEFVFLFCHAVERDLDKVLTMSSATTNKVFGDPTKELSDFIQEQYGVKLEKVDPAHPEYNPSTISFGDRIFVVEKMRGKTPQVKFLWKIKKIRDDLSHGRISDLQYENQSLSDLSVKQKMLLDYIALAVNIDKEETGGFVAGMTEAQHAEVDALWESLKDEIK